jgi:DNA-binding CsgD family transcriptional regulator
VDTVVAACPALSRPHTLGAIVDAVRVAVADVGALRLSPLAGALRPLLPEWGDELPPALEPAGDASAARHRLLRALAELFDRLGVRLLVLEDAHWADDTTLEFLLFLSARPASTVSLLVTCRPADLPADSLLPVLAARAPAGTTQSRIVLDPLDVDATARLVSTMLAGGPVSAEFAAFLHDRTGGVPLAVEESVRLMGQRADLIHRNGEWRRRRNLSDIVVPRSIRHAVLERVRGLDDDARAVLRVAAVARHPVPERIVVAGTGLPADAARAGLAGAAEAGLLGETRPGVVSVRHALVARIVYESIPAPQCRVLHRRVGTALAATVSPPVAQLARHFQAAGDTEQWCRYAELAADQATASGDAESADLLLYEAITEAAPPHQTLLRLVGMTSFGTITRGDRFGRLVAALRSVLGTGDLPRPARGELRIHLGRMLMMSGDRGAGRAEFEAAIPDLGHDPGNAARAMVVLGWPEGAEWSAEVYRNWLHRADDTADTAELPAGRRIWLTSSVACGLLFLGDDEGWAYAERVPMASAEPGNRADLIIVKLNLATMAQYWGRYAQAGALNGDALAAARQHQYRQYLDLGAVNQAYLDHLTGRWSGLAERVTALAADEELGPLLRWDLTLLIGLLELASGDYPRAGRRLRGALAELLRRGSMDHVASVTAALARLALVTGHPEEAVRLTAESVGTAGAQQLWMRARDMVSVRVAALAAVDRRAEAAELAAAFADWAGQRDMPVARATVASCTAVLADGGADPAAAAAAYERAAVVWEGLPQPYDALLAREGQAHALVRADSAAEGVALLRRTGQQLAQLGATGDAGRISDSLRRLGAGPLHRGGRPSYGDRLSPRELDVARLLVGGLTNRQIAERLYLSPKTVARHLDSAMRKLDATSRTALAVRLVESGIVVDATP